MGVDLKWRFKSVKELMGKKLNYLEGKRAGKSLGLFGHELVIGLDGRQLERYISRKKKNKERESF